MSAASRPTSDRACQSALAAETILRIFATKDESDWAWGLHQLAQDASMVAIAALESGDLDEVEVASHRYAMTNAVFSRIAHQADNEMLLAAEALLDATKDLIDAEAERLMTSDARLRPSCEKGRALRAATDAYL
jgi:hypothetical protein